MDTEKLLIGLASVGFGWVLAQFTSVAKDWLYARKISKALLEELSELKSELDRTRGCPEFCVNGFRLMLRHPVLELDSKPIQCGLPVTDWHGPFFTYVFQREVKQF